MKTFTVITTRREFQVDANTIQRASQRAGSVLKDEEIIIIADTAQVELNYSDGVVRAKR